MAIHPQVRITVRPYGSVVPLGFFAFGIGMFLYAAFDAPWVPATQGKEIGLMLVAFVGPLELISAVIAFLARDTMAGVALGLFAGSWLLTGFATMQAKPNTLSSAQGYFLIAFCIVVALLSLVAWLGQPLIAMLLTVSAVRGVLAAVYQLGGGRGWNQTAGWLALAIFCVAMYGGLAFLLEDAHGRAILPLGRRGSSREAIEEDLDVQLAGLGGEPGVRKHL
ncbi:MAG TPA: GPR1/FUN34/YaaH family transporter [Gaiellaceae bacterium]|nr:GPR1/FUN34/YaaH family transporter [Gaiellaceae bacterium]